MKIQIPQEVTQQFNKRTEDSFKAIFDLTFIQMRKYCASIIEDWDESEDVTLHSFLKLWYAKTLFNDSDHLCNTLIKIVRNESINFNNSLAAKIKKQTEDYIYEDVADEVYEYSEIIEEKINKIYAFIKTLPAACRLAMELRMRGLNCAEISKELGVSIDTVTSQHSRAIAKLRKYFAA